VVFSKNLKIPPATKRGKRKYFAFSSPIIVLKNGKK